MTSLALTRLLQVLLCLASLWVASAGAQIQSNVAQSNTDLGSDAVPAIELNLTYDAEYWRNTRGIIQAGRLLDLVSMDVAANGEALLGWSGVSLYASALYSSGHVMNEALLGTVQGISNIEASRALRLYESWGEWLYGNGKHSLKIGLYDLNSEFDAINTASLFINPSHGIGPDLSQSGRNGPSIFPVSSVAVRSLHSHGSWSMQWAVLDGIPGDPEHDNNTTVRLNTDEGAMGIVETGYASTNGLRVAAGYWQYSAQFADLQATDANGEALLRRGNRGWYGFADMALSPASRDDDHNHKGAFNVFIRYGQANSHINTLNSYLGFGAVYSGLLPGQRVDRLGLALSFARAGEPYRDQQALAGASSARHEAIAELTYLLPLTSWLSAQPDVQFIRHAGLSMDSADSWAFGIRFTLSSGWQF